MTAAPGAASAVEAAAAATTPSRATQEGPTATAVPTTTRQPNRHLCRMAARMEARAAAAAAPVTVGGDLSRARIGIFGQQRRRLALHPDVLISDLLRID